MLLLGVPSLLFGWVIDRQMHRQYVCTVLYEPEAKPKITLVKLWLHQYDNRKEFRKRWNQIAAQFNSSIN